MKFFIKSLIFLVTFSFVFTITISADEKTDNIIKYRQNLMKTIGASMGNIAANMKGEVDMMGDITYLAANMNNAAKLILPTFPKGSLNDETDATGKIWKDWKKFERLTNGLIESSSKLGSAALSGDKKKIGGALGAVGKNCKGCHKAFRKKK